MLKKDDGLHFDPREVDGYGCDANFIISEREPGKTTAYHRKAYGLFLRGFTIAILVRNAVEITEEFIRSLEISYIDFCDENFHFNFSMSDVRKCKGYCDLFIGEKYFGRIYALSTPVGRLKKLPIRNCAMTLMDEFIINPRFGEKYLKDEAFKFNELYTTIRRYSPNGRLKAYFLGNPYSLYNPYFVRYGIDTRKLKRGAVFTQNGCLVMCYEMKKELREKILKENPLYQFDDSYKEYAFDGKSINDVNIPLNKKPMNFSLRYVFKIQGKRVGLFRRNNYKANDVNYFCDFVDEISSKRAIVCFDFAELVENSILLSREDRFTFNAFKRAMQRREVEFSCIECYYLVEEIYYNL